MENFEGIEKYILDRMSSEERIAFELRLNNEPDLLQQKIELEKLIIGIESAGLKEKLSNRSIGESTTSKNPTKTRRLFSIQSLAIAASFIGILVAGLLVYNQPDAASENYYASVFDVDPGLPTTMSETDNYSFYDAMVDYKMEKYDQAIEKWQNNQGDIGEDTLNYYIGMAYLNTGNLDRAESTLTTIPRASAYHDLANWYRVKLLLDNDQVDQAKSLFNELPNDVHPNYDALKQALNNK